MQEFSSEHGPAFFAPQTLDHSNLKALWLMWPSHSGPRHLYHRGITWKWWKLAFRPQFQQGPNQVEGLKNVIRCSSPSSSFITSTAKASKRLGILPLLGRAIPFGP